LERFQQIVINNAPNKPITEKKEFAKDWAPNGNIVGKIFNDFSIHPNEVEESTSKATYLQAFLQKGKKTVLLIFLGGWMDARKLQILFFATATCNFKLFG
jgi:hypothetical protein